MKRSQRNLKRFSYETEIIRPSHDQAEKLIKEFGLEVKSGEYGTDGTWYQLPKSYPTVFFDLYGYIIVPSYRTLTTLPYIHITKYINIHEGIQILKDYVKYKHNPESIKDYNIIIEKINKTKEERQKEFEKHRNIIQKCINQMEKNQELQL